MWLWILDTIDRRTDGTVLKETIVVPLVTQMWGPFGVSPIANRMTYYLTHQDMSKL